MSTFDDELRVEVMLKVLREPDGWQRMLAALSTSIREASTEGFDQMIETLSGRFGEGSPEVESVRRRKDVSASSVSALMVGAFVLVAGRDDLGEEEAARFNVFLRAVGDMRLGEGVKEILDESRLILRRRYPRATSDEMAVPIEVLES
jgi:hypothetical protein